MLVNNRLDLAYQGVQGGHAVAQWLLEHPGQTWNNQTLVYLGCPDLPRWLDKLDLHDLRFSAFREPDLDNELTAVAVESDGKLFKNLRLMGK